MLSKNVQHFLKLLSICTILQKVDYLAFRQEKIFLRVYLKPMVVLNWEKFLLSRISSSLGLLALSDGGLHETTSLITVGFFELLGGSRTFLFLVLTFSSFLCSSISVMSYFQVFLHSFQLYFLFSFVIKVSDKNSCPGL